MTADPDDATLPDDQGWNAFYSGPGLPPWENGSASDDLLDAVARRVHAGGRILEIGAGTGVNAIALAQRGYPVVALEIAPAALEKAREAATRAGVAVDFRLADFLAPAAVPETFDALVDRAVFHTYRDADAAAFARRAADVLPPEGLWISICGSCDDRSGPSSFPKVTVAQIAAAVEPLFEIEELRRCAFPSASGHSFTAWMCVFRKRPTL